MPRWWPSGAGSARRATPRPEHPSTGPRWTPARPAPSRPEEACDDQPDRSWSATTAPRTPPGDPVGDGRGRAASASAGRLAYGFEWLAMRRLARSRRSARDLGGPAGPGAGRGAAPRGGRRTPRRDHPEVTVQRRGPRRPARGLAAAERSANAVDAGAGQPRATAASPAWSPARPPSRSPRTRTARSSWSAASRPTDRARVGASAWTARRARCWRWTSPSTGPRAADGAAAGGPGLAPPAPRRPAGLPPDEGDPDEVTASQQAAAGRVARTGWRARYPEVEVRSRWWTGSPAETLVEGSREAQLVVVGSRGHGGLQRDAARLGQPAAAAPQRLPGGRGPGTADRRRRVARGPTGRGDRPATPPGNRPATRLRTGPGCPPRRWG